jgi:sialate O-acetylesterase
MAVYHSLFKNAIWHVCLYFVFAWPPLAGQAQPKLRIASIFNSHAVLQQQQPVPVWGWSEPGDKVTIRLGKWITSAIAGQDGKWKGVLAPMHAGGPYEMVVSNNTDKLTFTDIWLGEVWLCSGQSNMEWKLSQAHNYSTEKTKSDFPQIRQYYVPHEVALQPHNGTGNGTWSICTPENAGAFTAVGYFFAKAIHEKLKVPVGIIHASWGGSQIEGWISRNAMLESEVLGWYARQIPATWAAADSLQDKKLRQQLLGHQLPVTPAHEQLYTQPDYQFKGWQPSQSAIGQWDWKGIWAFRGTGYMARQVQVPKQMTEVETELGLAIQDNYNEVYANGVLIYAGIQKGPRKIIVPAHTWKEGTNTLVLKNKPMQDPAWFGPGIMGNAADMYLRSQNNQIPLDLDWKLMPSFATPHFYEHNSNNVGTSIFNAMIAPLVPYALKGVLWYQGESNAERAFEYRHSLPLLIQDWRKQWSDSIGFYIAQLSSYGANHSANAGSWWAELREAQAMATQLPHTGMAITLDAGDAHDIHPTNKEIVGQRLALAALHQTYGHALPYSGPVYDAVEMKPGRAILHFQHTFGGLEAKGKYPYLLGFEIAGADSVFHFARANIEGDKVMVFGNNNEVPLAVRYAWSDAPIDANLYNAAGLPAGSFRTDNWPAITRYNTYESTLKKLSKK